MFSLKYKSLILFACLSLAVGGQSIADDEIGATDVTVDDGGVVINLEDEQSIKKLPTVYYEDSSTEIVDNTIYYDADRGVDVLVDGTVYTYNQGVQQDGILNLSIEQAQMMAINYSPTFKKALTQQMGAKGKRIAAIGQALPSLGLDASSTWSQSRAFEYDSYNNRPARDTLSERNTSLYGLTLSQPLFQGGAIFSAIRESKMYEDWVSEDIKTVRQAVIRTIRTQYYYTLYHGKLVEITKEQADIAKEYWEKTQRRYEADDVAEIEVLKYEVQYKIAEANYIKAKSNYDVYRVNVLRLIGYPLDTELNLVTPLDFREIDPGTSDELTVQALAARSELKSDLLQEQMQKEQIVQARSGLFPSVSAVAKWGQTNRWSSSSSNGIDKRGTDWSWSAGFQLSWNALAGGGQLIRGQIIQAKAILDSYEFATEDTEDMIKEEVKSSVLKLFSSIDWVKSQQENVAQAERVLEQETIRWEEGAGDYLDILNARETLASSQQLYWEGVSTYNVSVVDLEYSIGKYQNETGTVVQGYRVVKKRPNKIRSKAKKKDMFSHKTAEKSLDALAVPGGLEPRQSTAGSSKTGARAKYNTGFNMNVAPARIDSALQKNGTVSEVSPSAKQAKQKSIVDPKLFF